MKTKLPEPILIVNPLGDDLRVFTEVQLLAAMRDAYNEAIEDAANKVDSLVGKNAGIKIVMSGISEVIRLLKEQP